MFQHFIHNFCSMCVCCNQTFIFDFNNRRSHKYGCVKIQIYLTYVTMISDKIKSVPFCIATQLINYHNGIVSNYCACQIICDFSKYLIKSLHLNFSLIYLFPDIRIRNFSELLIYCWLCCVVFLQGMNMIITLRDSNAFLS